MTEIKVQCDCGQKYKFDVEPINGRMPFAVNCPSCGSDGTAKANEVLSRNQVPSIPVATAVPVPVAVSAAMAAPAAVGALPAAPPGLRLNRAAAPPPVPAGMPALPAQVAAPTAAPVPGTIAPIGNRPVAAGAAARAASGKKPSFGLGLAGALAGAVVGGIVYCVITYFIGFRLFLVSRFVAIGVGYLAGLGADLLGHKEGSKELGMITAVLALAAIFGAQYVNAKIWYRTEVGDIAATAYDAMLTQAKKVVAAVPTGSDAEIRAYLAADAAADSGEKADPAAVSAEDIKDFRENTLPMMRKLASGQTTKEEFEGKTETEMGGHKTADTIAFAVYFMGLVVKRSNIFAFIAAAAMAYKVSAGNA